MSINQTHFKDQETSAGVTPSLFTAETLPQTTLSPPERVPPPPRRPTRSTRGGWFVVIAIMVVVALIFSMLALVFSLRGQQPATQVTPTPTAPGATMTTTPDGDTTPAPTPGVTQGPQNGPPGVSETVYWDRILGTQGTNGKVEGVSFASIVGNPSLQALVTVRHNDSNRTLDAYVFDHVTNARPVQLFKLQGLVKGDAKISYYNSVLTAEADRSSPINAGKSSGQWTQDLFREFAWNQGERTLVQVAFPGIFPDLTRYQAEADQASVNQGHQPWKNDPAEVAKALTAQFLQWTRELSTTVLSGGGPQDVYATVRVQEARLQGESVGPSITVTLSRLEGNTHNLWVVISVADNQALTIQNIEARSQIANPVKIEGKGSAFEGVIGRAFILDHLYTAIGQAQVLGVSNGKTTYRTTVSYTSSFRGGAQEGIVVVFMYSQANGSIATAAMQKVMLSA